MEFLESQDPEKKKLVEASERHKRALEKGVADLSNDTQQLVKNALIIGGVMAISYLVVRGLSSGGKKKKHRKKSKVTVVQPRVSNDEGDDDEEESSAPGLLSGIGHQIANHATMVLIDIAREKLMEYLESRKKTE